MKFLRALFGKKTDEVKEVIKEEDRELKEEYTPYDVDERIWENVLSNIGNAENKEEAMIHFIENTEDGLYSHYYKSNGYKNTYYFIARLEISMLLFNIVKFGFYRSIILSTEMIRFLDVLENRLDSIKYLAKVLTYDKDGKYKKEEADFIYELIVFGCLLSVVKEADLALTKQNLVDFDAEEDEDRSYVSANVNLERGLALAFLSTLTRRSLVHLEKANSGFVLEKRLLPNVSRSELNIYNDFLIPFIKYKGLTDTLHLEIKTDTFNLLPRVFKGISILSRVKHKLITKVSEHVKEMSETLRDILKDNPDINIMKIQASENTVFTDVIQSENLKEVASYILYLDLSNYNLKSEHSSIVHLLDILSKLLNKEKKTAIVIFSTSDLEKETKSAINNYIYGIKEKEYLNNIRLVFGSVADGDDEWFRVGDTHLRMDMILDMTKCKITDPEIINLMGTETVSVSKADALELLAKNKTKPYFDLMAKYWRDEDDEPPTTSLSKLTDYAYNPKLLNIKGCNIDEMIKGSKRIIKSKTFKRLTILAYGQSGNGKTMLASHLAKELGLKLKTISGSDIVSKWVGESEKNVKSLFSHYSRNNLLLIEEADNLMTDRENGAERHYNKSLTNEWLVQIERFTGVLMITTNSMESIDSALLRRFTVKLEFKELLEENIPLALEPYIKKYKLKKDVELDEEIHRLKGLRLGDIGNVENLIEFYNVKSLSKYIEFLREEINVRNSRSENKVLGLL